MTAAGRYCIISRLSLAWLRSQSDESIIATNRAHLRSAIGQNIGLQLSTVNIGGVVTHFLIKTIKCSTRSHKIAQTFYDKKIDDKLELSILVRLVTLSETGHDVHLKSDALKALMDV